MRNSSGHDDCKGRKSEGGPVIWDLALCAPDLTIPIQNPTYTYQT